MPVSCTANSGPSDHSPLHADGDRLFNILQSQKNLWEQVEYDPFLWGPDVHVAGVAYKAARAEVAVEEEKQKVNPRRKGEPKDRRGFS
jgi:hypothetical protein